MTSTTRIVLTEKSVPITNDPDFDDDPFIDPATGKRKRIAKAPSACAPKRVAKTSVKDRTLLLTCALDELDRMLPHAEDGEGRLFVYPILNPGEQTDTLCTKLEDLTSNKGVEWMLMNSNDQMDFLFDRTSANSDAMFLTSDFFGLEAVAQTVCDKLIDLNGTNMIMIIDGGQVNSQNASAAKGDIAKLVLKWAALILKHKNRPLYDSMYSRLPNPSNSDYRTLLLDLGRAPSNLMMHARAKEHERTHDL